MVTIRLSRPTWLARRLRSVSASARSAIQTLRPSTIPAPRSRSAGPRRIEYASERDRRPAEIEIQCRSPADRAGSEVDARSP